MLFAVVGASSDPEESLLGVKDQLQKTGQADVADRLKAITAEDKKYGATYDDVVPKGQSAARAPRTSYGKRGNCVVMTNSRLARRMGDPVVAKASMNLRDGEQCTDAHIVSQYVNSILARVKWSKGRNVLKALRGMKLAGVQPRSSRRVSVTELMEVKPDEAANEVAMGSPKPADDDEEMPFLPVTEAEKMCRDINGPFAFCVFDTQRNLVFLARGLDSVIQGENVEAPALYWTVDSLNNNQLIVSTNPDLLPAESTPHVFPKGSYAMCAVKPRTELPEVRSFAPAVEGKGAEPVTAAAAVTAAA